MEVDDENRILSPVVAYHPILLYLEGDIQYGPSPAQSHEAPQVV